MHFAALPDVRAARFPGGPCRTDNDSGSTTHAEFPDWVHAYADRSAQAGVAADDIARQPRPDPADPVPVPLLGDAR